jgi:hypothetical protein
LKTESLPCSKCFKEHRFTDDELKTFDKNNKFVCDVCNKSVEEKDVSKIIDVTRDSILSRYEIRRREYEQRSIFYKIFRDEYGYLNFTIIPLVFFSIMGIILVSLFLNTHAQIISTAPDYKVEWDYLKYKATCNDFKTISKLILDKKFNENGTYNVQWNQQNVFDYSNSRILTDCK